jgi:hypothetical protein
MIEKNARGNGIELFGDQADLYIDVLVVETGADNPAPGFKALDKREFGNDQEGLVLPLKEIFNIALAVLAHHLDKFLEQVCSGGVTEIRNRLTPEIRAVGVNHDQGFHVIDPEVIFIVRSVAEFEG